MTWKELIARSAPLLLIIVLISYFAGDGWSSIPSALVAWGTILLAYATFSLIRQSKEQEARRIIFTQEEAKNNNNLRILNEVIQWATDIAGCSTNINVKDTPGLQRLLQSQAVKGPYIVNMVAPFNQNLVKAVLNLNKGLFQYIELVKQLADTPIKIKDSEHQKKLDAVLAHTKELTDIYIKVIDESTEIKLSILRQ